jgi:hypothetical protein
LRYSKANVENEILESSFSLEALKIEMSEMKAVEGKDRERIKKTIAELEPTGKVLMQYVLTTREAVKGLQKFLKKQVNKGFRVWGLVFF